MSLTETLKPYEPMGGTDEQASECCELLAAISTDELLERLPNNLHLARNDNAPEHDRWRIYNSHTEKYVEPGFPNARDLMLYTIDRLDTQFRDWTGG